MLQYFLVVSLKSILDHSLICNKHFSLLYKLIDAGREIFSTSGNTYIVVGFPIRTKAFKW